VQGPEAEWIVRENGRACGFQRGLCARVSARSRRPLTLSPGHKEQEEEAQEADRLRTSFLEPGAL